MKHLRITRGKEASSPPRGEVEFNTRVYDIRLRGRDEGTPSIMYSTVFCFVLLDGETDVHLGDAGGSVSRKSF